MAFIRPLPLVFGIGFVSLSSFGWSEIRYIATLETLEKLRIEMEVPVKGDSTTFQIPNFAPGHYVLLTVANDVSEAKATAPDGSELAIVKLDANTYQVKTPFKGSVKFTYSKPMRPRDGALLWQGPYEYMYVLGRKSESCRLTLRGPKDCRFAVSLDPVRGQQDVYTAPNYDFLADCPVSAGDLLIDKYAVNGIPHFASLYGAVKHEVDMPYLLQSCKKITEVQSAMFGDMPYKRYYWHFGISDTEGGGGGLEHLNSTNIRMGAGMSGGTLSLLSHEFFHLWNVKRIRSKPLGPFDYLMIPKTGSLWWMEGVTDYYADVMLCRAGIASEEDFFDNIVNNVRTTRANPRRLEVSPYDASFRVGEANGGRGNSQGFGVNYYNTGWVAGLCLDTELRARTLGKYSLDDVMKALYAKCKNDQPGFAEDEIRNQLIMFGGFAMGGVYDEWIMKAGELPVEAQMAKVGYRFSMKTIRRPDIGYSATASKTDRGMRIRTVRPGRVEQLKRDDVIVAINGVPCDFPTIRSIIGAYQKGLGKPSFNSEIKLKIRRGDQSIEVAYKPDATSFEGYAVERTDIGDARYQALRRGWLDQNR